MNKPVLIIKNISHEGPGLLEELLTERGATYEIVDLHQGGQFPDPANYSALVVCGGPDSANDDSTKMQDELKKIRKALDLQLPYIGICLGLQTLVKAAGGKVIKSPIKEIGFKDPENNNFSIELTNAGQQDPLFSNLGDSFKVLQLHGETVELTNDMTLLGTGKFVQNQAVRVGKNAWGLQCHFEVTKDMFEDWLKKDPDLSAMDANKLRTEFEIIYDEYTETGRKLFTNFLNGVEI